MLELSVTFLFLLIAIFVAYKLYETGYKISVVTYLVPFLFACCGIYPSLQHHIKDYVTCDSCNKKLKKRLCSEYNRIKDELQYVDMSCCEGNDAE